MRSWRRLMVAEAKPQAALAPTELFDALAALDPSAALADRLDEVEAVARWVIEVPALKRLARPARHHERDDRSHLAPRVATAAR